VPQSSRAQGLGIFGAFTIASYALGPTLGEAVIEALGFRPFFVYASLFSLIALLLVSFSSDADFKHSKDPSGLGFFRTVFSKRYAVPLLTNLILAGGFGSVLNFLSAFLKTRGLDVFYFFIVYTVTVSLVRVFGGGISDLLGRKKIASPSLLFFSLSIAAMAFVDSVYKLLAVSFLFSVSYGMLYPTLSALVIDRAKPDERGKAMGGFNACFSMGTNILTFGFGLIAKTLGFEGMYLIAGLFVFLGFLLFTFCEREEGGS